MIPREFLDHHRINNPTMTGLFYEPPKGDKGSGKEDGVLKKPDGVVCSTGTHLFVSCRFGAVYWYRHG